jgi:hypothetical protein
LEATLVYRNFAMETIPQRIKLLYVCIFSFYNFVWYF